MAVPQRAPQQQAAGGHPVGVHGRMKCNTSTRGEALASGASETPLGGSDGNGGGN